MQKIKFSLVNRIINENITSLEYDFLLYAAKVCDEKGSIKGLYYAELAKELHCCNAEFYLLRDNLTKKGFIKWEKKDGSDIDITLIDNNFIDDNGQIIYKDYLNTNISILNDKAFLQLPVGAKKVALELLKRFSASQNNKLWYSAFNLCKVFVKLIGVSYRTIKNYFKILKKWISVGYNVIANQKKYDIVTLLKNAMTVPQMISTNKKKCKSQKAYPEFFAHKHFIKMFCRRFKIMNEEINLNDTAKLIQQYKGFAKEIGKNTYDIICKAILNTKDLMLNSKNVHNSLRNILKSNPNSSIFDLEYYQKYYS